MAPNLEEMIRQERTMKMKEVKCQDEQEVIKREEKVDLTGRTELRMNLMMGRDARNYRRSSYKSQLQSKDRGDVYKKFFRSCQEKGS